MEPPVCTLPKELLVRTEAAVESSSLEADMMLMELGLMELKDG
jgi:hypothetical protein